MTTRLRFIKPWGPYKIGDILEVHSQRTVDWHVNECRRAVIEKPVLPAIPVIDVVLPEPKYLRQAPRDKMAKGPRLAKSGRYGQSGGE